MATISTRLAFASLVLGSLAFAAACGDDEDNGGTDAPTAIDAPAGGDGGDIDAAGNPDGAAAPSCTDYCTTIAANCTAANLMYANNTECMATCMMLPAGTVGMMATNTVGCRLYHAGAAAGNANLHCRHAGPGGDGACGANCEGFCTIVLASCTGGNEQFGGNMATCMSECAQFATTPDYVATETTGDTFACRLYHATAAAAAPVTHCSHVATSSPVCQ